MQVLKLGETQGIAGYTSRGNIKRKFNLTNWKWVKARKDKITAVINLHTLEQDSKTKNIHVLFDRISIDVFKDEKNDILSEKSDSYLKSIKFRYRDKVENQYSPEFVKDTITDINLPLEKEDLAAIIKIIENKIDRINSNN